MTEEAVKLFQIMFKEGERVCVSDNEFGYHSIPIENVLQNKITLVPPTDKSPIRRVNSSNLKFVALNPIKGFRRDSECTAFRSFLVEMDVGTIKEQLAYIKAKKVPYSACIFSGNKSLHFLITLDKDLPNESVYRVFSEWILNIITAADSSCKNPSRSIRIPGAIREPGKIQRAIELNSCVKLEDLVMWLSQYPHLKPKEREKRERFNVSGHDSYEFLSESIKKKLFDGIDPAKGRNKQWFAISCEMALSGYSEDDTIDLLQRHFHPDRDFKQKEWETTIRSAFKYMYKK